MRRIITGHNHEGKSVVKIDGGPSRSVGEEVGGLFEIWSTDDSSVDSTDSIDRADTDIVLSPTPGGSKLDTSESIQRRKASLLRCLRNLQRKHFKA